MASVCLLGYGPCIFILGFVLFDISGILGSIANHHGKYDLVVDDLNDFCPLVPGFDEFDTRTDSRATGKDCYMYTWIPDPCTMEKSGRVESDLLHCGHYSMIPCTDAGLDDRSLLDGLSGFDLPWQEVQGLCDVVNIKNRTKKVKKVKPMYWKWTFCEKESGTEMRPCGHYSMAIYTGKEHNLPQI